MTDSNRNLAARALLVLAELGAAMGSPIERVARPTLGPALACLSDKKKQVRATMSFSSVLPAGSTPIDLCNI